MNIQLIRTNKEFSFDSLDGIFLKDLYLTAFGYTEIDPYDIEVTSIKGGFLLHYYKRYYSIYITQKGMIHNYTSDGVIGTSLDSIDLTNLLLRHNFLKIGA